MLHRASEEGLFLTSVPFWQENVCKDRKGLMLLIGNFDQKNRLQHFRQHSEGGLLSTFGWGKTWTTEGKNPSVRLESNYLSFAGWSQQSVLSMLTIERPLSASFLFRTSVVFSQWSWLDETIERVGRRSRQWWGQEHQCWCWWGSIEGVVVGGWYTS